MTRCIGLKWPTATLGLGLNGQWPFGVGSSGQRWTFDTSDVPWYQKSTLVYTLNPELMCGPIVMYRSTDLQICQSHNLLRICIYINNF